MFSTVLLALVAFTLAKIPESPQEITEKQERTMIKNFKIMETISLIKWRLIDHKKLANKYVHSLKEISRINWRLIELLFEQKIISLNRKTTINGYPIDLAIMLKTLDIICKIDWTQPDSSPAKSKQSRSILLFLSLKNHFSLC